jgi:hypothetical protein
MFSVVKRGQIYFPAPEAKKKWGQIYFPAPEAKEFCWVHGK